eukprot:GHVS01067151.1.p1 GENE.GHVS01067151.1~~GHVS01067151.1.p1  ORF type:complete len:761 (-),score=59.06 GHVS01067151.1:586-2868(-)
MNGQFVSISSDSSSLLRQLPLCRASFCCVLLVVFIHHWVGQVIGQTQAMNGDFLESTERGNGSMEAQLVGSIVDKAAGGEMKQPLNNPRQLVFSNLTSLGVFSKSIHTKKTGNTFQLEGMEEPKLGRYVQHQRHHSVSITRRRLNGNSNSDEDGDEQKPEESDTTTGDIVKYLSLDLSPVPDDMGYDAFLPFGSLDLLDVDSSMCEPRGDNSASECTAVGGNSTVLREHEAETTEPRQGPSETNRNVSLIHQQLAQPTKANVKVSLKRRSVAVVGGPAAKRRGEVMDLPTPLAPPDGHASRSVSHVLGGTENPQQPASNVEGDWAAERPAVFVSALKRVDCEFYHLVFKVSYSPKVKDSHIPSKSFSGSNCSVTYWVAPDISKWKLEDRKLHKDIETSDAGYKLREGAVTLIYDSCTMEKFESTKIGMVVRMNLKASSSNILDVVIRYGEVDGDGGTNDKIFIVRRNNQWRKFASSINSVKYDVSIWLIIDGFGRGLTQAVGALLEYVGTADVYVKATDTKDSEIADELFEIMGMNEVKDAQQFFGEGKLYSKKIEISICQIRGIHILPANRNNDVMCSLQTGSTEEPHQTSREESVKSELIDSNAAKPVGENELFWGGLQDKNGNVENAEIRVAVEANESVAVMRMNSQFIDGSLRGVAPFCGLSFKLDIVVESQKRGGVNSGQTIKTIIVFLLMPNAWESPHFKKATVKQSKSWKLRILGIADALKNSSTAVRVFKCKECLIPGLKSKRRLEVSIYIF